MSSPNNEQLMQEIGSKEGYDPIPPRQHMRLMESKDPLEQAMAWVYFNTIRYRNPVEESIPTRTAYACDVFGRALDTSDLAAHYHWTVRKARRAMEGAIKKRWVKKDEGKFWLRADFPVARPVVTENRREEPIAPAPDPVKEWLDSLPEYQCEAAAKLARHEQLRIVANKAIQKRWKDEAHTKFMAALRAIEEEQNALLYEPYGIPIKTLTKRRQVPKELIGHQLELFGAPLFDLPQAPGVEAHMTPRKAQQASAVLNGSNTTSGEGVASAARAADPPISTASTKPAVPNTSTPPLGPSVNEKPSNGPYGGATIPVGTIPDSGAPPARKVSQVSAVLNPNGSGESGEKSITPSAARTADTPPGGQGVAALPLNDCAPATTPRTKQAVYSAPPTRYPDPPVAVPVAELVSQPRSNQAAPPFVASEQDIRIPDAEFKSAIVAAFVDAGKPAPSPGQVREVSQALPDHALARGAYLDALRASMPRIKHPGVLDSHTQSFVASWPVKLEKLEASRAEQRAQQQQEQVRRAAQEAEMEATQRAEQIWESLTPADKSQRIARVQAELHKQHGHRIPADMLLKNAADVAQGQFVREYLAKVGEPEGITEVA